jgi:NADP-dependent aldehyde dehydrogenase
LAQAKQTFEAATPGTLLSEEALKNLAWGVAELQKAGAQVACGGAPGDAARCCFKNTLLTATGAQFLAHPHGLQTEAFGNAGLVVVCDSLAQVGQCLRQLEGNLTGCVYSHTQGADDAAYAPIARILRQKVGRLLNDKMPTGVAVSAAMNHGGPFPATGHPGFSAVGVPVSLRRFAMLQSFDAVRENRLPDVLRNGNPTGIQRLVDGAWTAAPIG